MSSEAVEAVEALYRSDWGRIVAILIGQVHDFDLAEESAQEVSRSLWSNGGFREYPISRARGSFRTARHKAIDRIRRRARSEEKLEMLVTSGLVPVVEEPDYGSIAYNNMEIFDERYLSPDLHVLPPGARSGRRRSP